MKKHSFLNSKLSPLNNFLVLPLYAVFCLVVLALSLLSCRTVDTTERKINNLLAQMTLEEKIGQLNQLDLSWAVEEKAELIRQGMVGSVFNIVDPQEINRLQHIAVEDTRLGIPLVVGRDVIHGFKTIYPIPLGQAATWNPALVENAARLTAGEAVQVGIRWSFSPMVDVARDPRWGRIAEGYGEDTYLASQMASAVVRGYQYSQTEESQMAEGQTISGMAACVKHFAGYSASEGGRDYNTTWIPEIQLRDVYLPPFKSAIDAGAASVMCSFNDLNGLPSSANRWLNVDLLRNEWGFDGLLVSDWGSGSDMVPHGLVADKREAALRAIDARMEMDMQGGIYTDYLAQLVAEGKVSERQIDDCVRSVLRMKFRLGLFDNPYVPEDVSGYYSDASLAAATQAVEEGAILLKNNGVLPLLSDSKATESTTNVQPPMFNRQCNTEKRTVLICGPLADQKKEQLGTWVFDAEPEHSITPLMAFNDLQTKGLNILYEAGLTYSRDRNTDFSRVLQKARLADVILFFCGEEAILSGEARCRTTLDLPGAQPAMMEALAATGKPVVMVVMAGRPLSIGKQVEQAAAVVYSFHGGTMAGPGLCNVLTGKHFFPMNNDNNHHPSLVTTCSPSGKCPVTFPKMVGQVPLYYNRHNTGRPSYEPPMLLDEIPIGCPQFSIGQSSYWLDTPTEPLFPFGYGLSYTTFEYGKTCITSHAADTGIVVFDKSEEAITLSCTITNTGTTDAYETAQLYVHQLSGYLVRPIKELKGFKKVFIPAGESRELKFTLTPKELGYWHESKSGNSTVTYFATDVAPFEAWIAPHSDAKMEHARFRLAE